MVLAGAHHAPILDCGADLLDVELLHLEHRVHPPACPVPVIGVVQEPHHLRRNDLPRDAKPILQPAARAWLAAIRSQELPVAVDLGLILALDEERDRLVEPEVGTAVEAHERLAIERERDRQDLALIATWRVGRGSVDPVDPAVREDPGVELGGFLGSTIEPEARRDAWHGIPPRLNWPVCRTRADRRVGGRVRGMSGGLRPRCNTWLGRCGSPGEHSQRAKGDPAAGLTLTLHLEGRLARPGVLEGPSAGGLAMGLDDPDRLRDAFVPWVVLRVAEVVEPAQDVVVPPGRERE